MVENRFLFGGIDADTALQNIDKDALLNAVNVRAVVSQNQSSTDIQYIEGNTSVAAITPLLGGRTYKLLGKCADNATDAIYLFLRHITLNPTKRDIIVKYDTTQDTAAVLLQAIWFADGFGWTDNMFIDCDAANNLLIWSDGVNPIRYLDLTFNYAGYATPINPNLISLVTEPPAVPLSCVRATNAAVNSTIQNRAMQFCYRITNGANFVSVISPYSSTVLPVRQSDIASNPYFGNTVNVTVPYAQKFPADWKQIELIVRFNDSNTFFVIRQWNVSVGADGDAVDQHNSGFANLAFDGWFGNTIYAIDKNAVAKLFDNVPIKNVGHARIANRLFVFGNLEGYDTPVESPGYTKSLSQYTTIVPNTVGTFDTYMIGVKKATTDTWYFAVVYRTGGKNYLLPKDCATGTFESVLLANFFNPTASDSYAKISDYVWNVPNRVSRLSITELGQSMDFDASALGNASITPVQQIRYSIVAEANNVSFDTTGEFWLWNFGTVTVEGDAFEKGDGGKSRTFLPNSKYRLGMRWYDEALRACGVKYLEDITIPAYGAFSKTLTESLSVAVNNLVAPPGFAKYFALTLSGNQKAQKPFQFIPNIIKSANRKLNGEIVYGGYRQLIDPPADTEVYGLAIPMESIQSIYGYEFKEGDYVEIAALDPVTLTDATIRKAFVKDFRDGNLIVSYEPLQSAYYQSIVADAGKYLFVTTSTGSFTAGLRRSFNIVPAPLVYKQYRVIVTVYPA